MLKYRLINVCSNDFTCMSLNETNVNYFCYTIMLLMSSGWWHNRLHVQLDYRFSRHHIVKACEVVVNSFYFWFHFIFSSIALFIAQPSGSVFFLTIAWFIEICWDFKDWNIKYTSICVCRIQYGNNHEYKYSRESL